MGRSADADGAPDAFGQRRGGEREALRWPVQVHAPVLGIGELLNIGSDGACLSLSAAPGAGERLRILIEGETVTAMLELEARWQRRTSRERWQVGAFAIVCAVTRGG